MGSTESVIRALIVDDEVHGRKNLQFLLEEECSGVEVVALAASAGEGLRLIREHRPHLVFLDIQMPGGSGFDMLESLPEIDFAVIFTTSYSEHAVRAFKYSAQDYLLKPIDLLDLQASLLRYERNRLAPRQEQMKIHRQVSQGAIPGKIGLSSSDGYTFADLEDVLFLSSDGNYTTFHFASGSKSTVSRQLGEYEELLPGNAFFRIHASYIINSRHLKKYVRGKGGIAEMSDGTRLDVSQRRKKAFLEFLQLK